MLLTDFGCSNSPPQIRGTRKAEKQENTRVKKNRSRREKRLTDVTTSMKKWKKIHTKDRVTKEQR